MAHAKLRTRDDVDPALFTDWLGQARRLTEARGQIPQAVDET